jgi:alkylation response protein AidB-like acyl-CoA dehydrogenase
MTMSSVSLGIAEGAVEEFATIIGKRVIAFTGGVRPVDQAAAHLRLGEAIASLRAAQALWNTTLQQVIDAYEHGGALTVFERVKVRQTASIVARTSSEIVHAITASTGGSSYFDSCPLQRMQRDAEVLKSHASLDWDRGAQMVGRVALGLPLAPPDLF